MSSFRHALWQSPRDLEALRQSLKNKKENAYLISGGTDLIIKLNKSRPPVDMFIDLSHVNELRQIKINNRTIMIGSAVTHRELTESTLIKENLPILSMAADSIGSLQIRNRGSIGGNVASATPANDLLTVLFALEARVEIIDGSGGRRILPIDDFIVSIGKTALESDEAISSFQIGTFDGIGNYAKLGGRSQVSIAQITGAYLARTEKNTVRELKLYLGTIGSKPVNLAQADQLFRGLERDQGFPAHIVDRCAGLFTAYIAENVPIEFDRDYKVKAVKGLLYDLFEVR